MYRKVLITGVTAAAIVGAGGTALALSGSDQTSGTPSNTTSSAPAKAGKHDHKGNRMLRRLAHGQFVVKGKDGKFETHDIIRGTVTAVSATSITVQAQDKKSETFAVNKDTKVRVRDNGKGAASTISKVAKGDRVMVAGTGTSSLTAKHVVDVKGR
jgi:Domain of unknown function (DUF5666)